MCKDGLVTLMANKKRNANFGGHVRRHSIVFMLHMLCLSLASAIHAVAASSSLPGLRIMVVSSMLAQQQQRGKTFSTVVNNARDSSGAART